MKKEIRELQKLMAEEGIDAYYVPSSDYHGSEYVHPYFRCREFLSGFDGSAGELLVTCDAAYLWTDGRYFLQAEHQLAGSGIELMKMREEGVPTVIEFISGLADEFLKSHEDDFVIGFDGRTVDSSFGFKLEDALSDISFKYPPSAGRFETDTVYDRIRIKWDEDLAGRIWSNRPKFTTQSIWSLPVESAGVAAADKVRQARAVMKDEGADYLVLSDLTSIAWLLNIRGSDIAYTPVFYSYVMICPDCLNIYLTDTAIAEGGAEIIEQNIGETEIVFVRSYDEIIDDIASIEHSKDITFMTDNKLSYSMYLTVSDVSESVHQSDAAAADFKMIKNPVEIECTRNAHVKDGVAVTKFIRWIKAETAAGCMQSEISAAEHLESLRSEQDGFIEPSFATISAYGPNGAIVHYEADLKTNALIKPEGFLLVDSGGHYMDGTTDITRTIAVGPLTQEMTDNYTYALKSHIAYARMRYEEGMKSCDIDGMVRKPLRDAGLDFNHGISHGVGHVLSVHEDAATIRSTSDLDAYIRAGMVMSDEPGVYIEGEYGIRIENLVLHKDDGNGGVINEALTMAPYEREAINRSLLTKEEIEWIDDYHSRVRETLSPYLEGEDLDYLISATMPL